MRVDLVDSHLFAFFQFVGEFSCIEDPEESVCIRIDAVECDFILEKPKIEQRRTLLVIRERPFFRQLICKVIL